MGQAITRDLIKDDEIREVCIIDIDEKQLKRLKNKLNNDKIKTKRLDVKNKAKLSATMEDYDCIVDALPHKFVVDVNENAVETRKNMVDLAFEPEQMLLDKKAKEKDVILVPGCGVAPGLSNMLVGYGAKKMDRVREIRIRVGGIPLNPIPPLDYKIVFSVESVINEYTRPARIILNGRQELVLALAGVEKFNHPSLGELECFYTDGLSTLPYTMKNVETMWEKTIRWPGHAEKIKAIRELGFFDREEIKLKDTTVRPYELATKLLSEKMKMEEGEEDITILMVDVIGEKDSQQIECKYELVDYYDPIEKITSMGRTSGFTCAIVSRMIAKGEIKKRGVIPTERLFTKEQFEKIIKELSRRGIEIKETVIQSKMKW